MDAGCEPPGFNLINSFISVDVLVVGFWMCCWDRQGAEIVMMEKRTACPQLSGNIFESLKVLLILLGKSVILGVNDI